MRSIKNRLLLKGRKNKQTIITILLALAIVVGTSNALDFCIDHKDVAIAVNKDIAGNQVPDDKGTVGIATNSILMVEAKGCHIRVDGYSFPLGPGVPKSNTASIGIHRPCSLANDSVMRCSISKGLTCGWPSPCCASYSLLRRRSSSAIAAIRLFSASCAPSLPCETDLRMS